MDRTQVLVVGGGIGGLATAIALRQQGFDVMVVEQAPELSEIGAGLQLSANAMWVMDDLGLADEVARLGVAAKSIRFHHLDSGESVFSTLLGPKSAERYGQTFHQIHRADLLDILARAVPEEIVRLGSRVNGIVQGDDSVVVTLDGGHQIEADIVVGADGIHSRVREDVLGPTDPEFSGVLGWRAMLTKEQVEDLGIDHSCDCWLGPGRSVVTYWLRGGELFNVIGFVPAAEVHRESWVDMGDVDEMRESFAGSCSMVERLMNKIDKAFITGVYYHQPAEQWSKGRLVLLGDAAHATVPYLAQGACQAIEDAAVLARILRKHEDHAAAFAEYEQRRRPRTTKVQSVARGSEGWWHEADDVQISARDGMFRGVTTIDPLTETVWRWLYDHNPITSLERPAEEALGLSTVADSVRMERPLAQRAFDLWRGAFTPEDHAGGWRGLRAGYERFLAEVTPYGDAPVTEIAEISTLRVGEDSSEGPVVLHLHGGGYMFGSARSSLGYASRISEAIGGAVYSVDYRRGPEHAYPAALDDSVSAYRWLVDQGVDSRRIIVTGESAGGGLALATVRRILDEGLPAPAGVWVLSPFADLALEAPSIDQRDGRDPVVNRDLLTQMSGAYAQGHDPRDPRVSPVYADYTGFPPILLHAAENEALRDDAVRVAKQAEAAGVPVDLHLVPDSVHIFAILDFLPESQEALDTFAGAAHRWTATATAEGSAS